MAHPIIWLPEAAEDLQQIFDFVGQTSPAYAGSVIGRVLDAVENLQQFPRMGHAVAEIRIKRVALRELAVPPYRVIYRLRDDRVVILAVIHGARRLRNGMRGRRLG